mmetsp:Transcript_6280/g.5630  ORF Transcript_6280/g.5630 Transcript_6280/m.5630 type:complete len:157 (+) Transcript_6280:308-778(+)
MRFLELPNYEITQLSQQILLSGSHNMLKQYHQILSQKNFEFTEAVIKDTQNILEKQLLEGKLDDNYVKSKNLKKMQMAVPLDKKSPSKKLKEGMTTRNKKKETNPIKMGKVSSPKKTDQGQSDNEATYKDYVGMVINSENFLKGRNLEKILEQKEE